MLGMSECWTCLEQAAQPVLRVQVLLVQVLHLKHLSACNIQSLRPQRICVIAVIAIMLRACYMLPDLRGPPEGSAWSARHAVTAARVRPQSPRQANVSGRVQASRAAMLKGLALSAACGISYGLYSPAFNIATNDHFNMAGPGASPLLHSLQMCASSPRREPNRKTEHGLNSMASTASTAWPRQPSALQWSEDHATLTARHLSCPGLLRVSRAVQSTWESQQEGAWESICRCPAVQLQDGCQQGTGIPCPSRSLSGTAALSLRGCTACAEAPEPVKAEAAACACRRPANERLDGHFVPLSGPVVCQLHHQHLLPVPPSPGTCLHNHKVSARLPASACMLTPVHLQTHLPTPSISMAEATGSYLKNGQKMTSGTRWIGGNRAELLS